jgi:predicted TIM-barrel fold metal-dependent hydrolase
VGAPSKNQQWLAKVNEEALEPALPICDPHHHLWDQRHEREQERYLLDEILDDLAGGHNVVSTVFIECGAMFKPDGPEAYRCVGETEFVNGIAAMSASGLYGKARIAAGIIGTVDLRIGDKAADVLDAQIAAGGGRFRGIRRGAFWHASPQIQNHRTNPPEHLLLHDDFRSGFKHLAPRRLSFEVWCAHTQIPDAVSLARAFPDTTIVLEHTIERFGPDRCMFESNFPVDKLSCSYTVLWNSFKLLTKGYSADERKAMFHDTAARVYRL